MAIFFASFEGRALPEPEIANVLQAFPALPHEELIALAAQLHFKVDPMHCLGWKDWLDNKGCNALLAALNEAECLWYAEHDSKGWVFLSPMGQGVFGLAKFPPPPKRATTFQALPNLCVFAGAGLALEKLVPLFRYCVVKRIDQVYEFQLDPRRLAQAAAGTSPGEKLHEVLRELEPLPATIARLLETKTSTGGKIGIHLCSALVKPESAEVLEAIRRHPRLKGYLEAGAPPGYLLLKAQSSPDNFILRCHELGFKVEAL